MADLGNLSIKAWELLTLANAHLGAAAGGVKEYTLKSDVEKAILHAKLGAIMLNKFLEEKEPNRIMTPTSTTTPTVVSTPGHQLVEPMKE